MRGQESASRDCGSATETRIALTEATKARQHVAPPVVRLENSFSVTSLVSAFLPAGSATGLTTVEMPAMNMKVIHSYIHNINQS